MTTTLTPTVINPSIGEITLPDLGNNNGALISPAEVIDEWGGENHPNFIESNTQAISLEELRTKNIIPTFCDNTLTISHQNFIGAVLSVAANIFGPTTLPELRVSHPIIGRIPSAQNKKPNELTEDEKTIFYQRMAFCSQIISRTNLINGQAVNLTIGGVRAYSDDKLYARQAPQKFKIFVGWRVRVCSNLMLTCDGVSGTIECMTEADIMAKSYQLFSTFNPNENLRLLENLRTTRLSEEQFCNIVGRLRLQQALPTAERNLLPKFDLGDQAVNNMVRGYVSNPNFGRERDDFTCWNLLQLANEAVKQTSYIDRFIDRNQNATDFALGIQNALNHNDDKGYDWFLH